MAPNITSQTLLLAAETESVHTKSKVVNNSTNYTSPISESDNLGLGQEKENYEWKISWRNVLAFIYLHTAGVYGLLLMLTGHTKILTIIFGYLVAVAAGLGVTAGAHRLWAHKAYKAKWQFRLILAFFQAMAFQNHIYEWVRDHRVHHKFTDTNADPHNAQRGFFFSHIGWLMIRKHPDVKNKGKTVDMSDLEKDPIVMWQKKFYLIVMPFLTFVFPTIVPIYCWNEDPWIAWYTCIFRYALSLNGTWLVNSAAHIWGTKPYDKNISPTENKAVGIIAFGEGWHNYHHVFPWDYKAAELGNYRVNMTTGLIDFFAKIGWAYDLKTVPLEMIKKRAERTGDGSLKDPHDPRHHMNSVWGWDDKDMSHEDKLETTVYHPKLE